MARNPSQTREMLKRYEFIVNTSRDWHTLINRSYIYEAANQAFCQAHGKTQSEIVGNSLSDIWGPKTFDQNIRTSLDRCFEGHEVNYQAWFEVPTIGLQCYDISCYPYRDRDGLVTHVVVVTRNITRRKLADDAKRKLEIELQQARKIEALATLSGGIAHEFNNALMVVAGNIELLQMTLGDNDEVRKFARATNESIQRMTNLTQQMLAYARAGDYWLKPIELSGLVRSILPRIEAGITTGIRLETQLKIGLPTIKADPDQLQQIVASIVQNAVEAIEAQGRIVITTSERDIDQSMSAEHPGLEPGRYVSLAVEDNGRGMDEKTRSRVFEPFFSTKFQGRGLGMAAVYGIIKNHRGFIYIESTPGQGTLVQVLFPTVEDNPRVIHHAGGSDSGEQKTILVIDDEENVLSTIQSLLERLGYLVLGAESGQAAVDIAKTYHGGIHLALLDVKLPDMEGGALYPILQQVRPDLKVIVCSGYALGPRVREILDAGAHGFLQKPFSLNTIKAKLDEVLGS